MDYNAEQYFLRGITKNQNISVKKALTKTMYGFLLTTILIWILFHVIVHFADNDLNVFLLNVLFFPLVPIVLLLSKKTVDAGFSNYMKNLNKQKENNSLIKAVSFSGAAVGFVFARFLFSHLDIQTIEILLIFIVLFILLIMLFCAAITFYKKKLIEKHCPDLLTRIV